MAVPLLDTNIIIRFLTGDDPKKQAACAHLFEAITQGKRSVFVPDVVIAECVYVLASPRLYNHSRQEIAELLLPLVQLSHLEVQNRQVLLQALHLFAETQDLDFADAFLVASLEQAKTNQLISYDTDFDHFPFIFREDPTNEKKVA